MQKAMFLDLSWGKKKPCFEDEEGEHEFENYDSGEELNELLAKGWKVVHSARGNGFGVSEDASSYLMVVIEKSDLLP